jgi:Mg-chelatase subunit ChlD
MKPIFLSKKGIFAAILVAVVALALTNFTALLAQNEDLSQFYAALTILLAFEHEAGNLIQSLEDVNTPQQMAEFEGLLERFEILYSATTQAIHELEVSVGYRDAFDKLASASNCMRRFINNLRQLFATSDIEYMNKSVEELLLYKKNLTEAVSLLPKAPVYDVSFLGSKVDPEDSRVVYLSLNLRDRDGSVINTNIDKDDYSVSFDDPSIAGTVEDVYSNPSIKGAPRIILLLIDSSGSMQNADPYRKRVDAACRIIDRLEENDYVIVAEFGNSKVSPFMKVLGIGTGQQESELRGYIQQVGQNGDHTPLYASISEGIMVMNSLSEEIQQQFGGSLLIEYCIIVLTDGEENFKPDTSRMDAQTARIYQELLSKPEFVILAARKTSIPIYTIGLSQNVDTSTLNMIASKTDGLFGETVSADGLEAIYNQFSAAVQEGQTVLKIRLNRSVDSLQNLSFRVHLSESISARGRLVAQAKFR